MATKMAVCKHCGAKIAKSAKVCPNCGGKNKKPIFMRPWFIILVVLIVLGAAGGAAGSGSKQESPSQQSGSGGETKGSTDSKTDTSKPIVYEDITVGKLMDDLDANALKAADTYKGNYYAVTGRLSTIDASGKYISIVNADEQYAILGVQCYIKTDEIKSIVMDLSSNEVITVKGKMRDVGEVLGYSLDIDSIERQ